MLSGQGPYADSTSAPKVMFAHCYKPVPDPRDGRPRPARRLRGRRRPGHGQGPGRPLPRRRCDAGRPGRPARRTHARLGDRADRPGRPVANGRPRRGRRRLGPDAGTAGRRTRRALLGLGGRPPGLIVDPGRSTGGAAASPAATAWRAAAGRPSPAPRPGRARRSGSGCCTRSRGRWRRASRGHRRHPAGDRGGQRRRRGARPSGRAGRRRRPLRPRLLRRRGRTADRRRGRRRPLRLLDLGQPKGRAAGRRGQDHLLLYPVQYEGLEDSPNIIYLGAAPNQQLLPAVKWAFTELGRRFFHVGSDYVFPRAAGGGDGRPDRAARRRGRRRGVPADRRGRLRRGRRPDPGPRGPT